MEPKRVRLKKATIKASLASVDAVDALLIVWRAVEPNWDNLTSINPSDYQIPRSQALALLAGRAEVSGFGGLWLNNGPGSFDDSDSGKRGAA